MSTVTNGCLDVMGNKCSLNACVKKERRGCNV